MQPSDDYPGVDPNLLGKLTDIVCEKPTSGDKLPVFTSWNESVPGVLVRFSLLFPTTTRLLMDEDLLPVQQDVPRFVEEGEPKVVVSLVTQA